MTEGNTKPDLYISSGVPLVYALPTPPGAYLNGTGTCKEAYCPDGQGGTKRCPPSQQLCPSEYYNKVIADIGFQREDQSINGPFPPKCPPGFYGNTTHGQLTSVCSGFCPEGHACPHAGTISPEPTTPGFYAPPGSKTPLACGGPSVICPREAESGTTPVGDGNESFTDPTLVAKYGLHVNDSSTRTSQEPCRFATAPSGTTALVASALPSPVPPERSAATGGSTRPRARVRAPQAPGAAKGPLLPPSARRATTPTRRG
jgi:hypothetical protein